MLTKIPHKKDTQLSNEALADLIINDALIKISQFTGLNRNKAYELLASQIKGSNNCKVTTKENAKQINVALLNQSEMQFIKQLFH